jgi:hypothetical protein
LTTFSLNARRFALCAGGALLALAANTKRAIADVVGPGQLTSFASLSGTFGVGAVNSIGTQFDWNDQLFALPGINDPNYRILVTVVLEGSNPTALTGGAKTVTTRGILDFVTFQNIVSSEIVVTDQQFTRQTLVFSMPLYGFGFPTTGALTSFRMSLQSIAGINVTSGSTTGSTSSDFSAYLQNIRAVDGQGNDITTQLGLRTASGFMGTAPEPGTLVLFASGLLLLPFTNASVRRRILKRSV